MNATYKEEGGERSIDRCIGDLCTVDWLVGEWMNRREKLGGIVQYVENEETEIFGIGNYINIWFVEILVDGVKYENGGNEMFAKDFLLME